MPVSTGKARARLRADTDPVVNSMLTNSVVMHLFRDKALLEQAYSSHVVSSVAGYAAAGVADMFDDFDDGARSEYYKHRATSVVNHRSAAKREKALHTDILQFAGQMEPYGSFLQNQRDVQAVASRLGDMRLTNKRNYVSLKKDKRRRLFQKKVER